MERLLRPSPRQDVLPSGEAGSLPAEQSRICSLVHR